MNKTTMYRSSFYARWATRSGGLGCHFGYLMPDLAMGLSFSGYSVTYPFTPGYPLRKPRAIIGRTSFYGKAFLGVAVNARSAGFEILCFCARPGGWSERGFIVENKPVAGLRLIKKSPSFEGGITLWKREGPVMAGVDWRGKAGRMDLAAEISCGSAQGPAVTCGFNSREAVVNTGLVVYSAAAGSLPSSGDIPGGRGDSGLDRRGLSLVLDRKLPGGLKLRYAFEHDMFGAADRRQTRSTSRAGVSSRWRGREMRVDWIWKEDNDLPAIPFPPARESSSSTGQSVNILVRSRSSGSGWRLSILCPWSDLSAGLLFSPSIRIRSGSGRSRLDLSCALYKSFRGTEGFYCYEPVIKSGYPWKYLGGGGGRTVIMGSTFWKGVRMTCRFLADTRDGYDVDIQSMFEF